MTEAVLAIDMVNEQLGRRGRFEEWFSNRGYEIGDETLTKGDEVLIYNIYYKANVFIFKFDNTGDYFPAILVDFIGSLTNLNETQVSVAEEGQFGEYNTLVDMKLSDFIGYVIEGDDELLEG